MAKLHFCLYIGIDLNLAIGRSSGSVIECLPCERGFLGSIQTTAHKDIAKMVAHGSLVSAEDRSDFSPLKPRLKNGLHLE